MTIAQENAKSIELATEIECSSCDGDGFITCPNCNGAGFIGPEQRATCGMCHKEGRVQCRDCDADGFKRVRATVEDDWFDRVDRVAQLLRWCAKRGDDADALVSVAEKPQRWAAEMCLAVLDLDAEPMT